MKAPVEENLSQSVSSAPKLLLAPSAADYRNAGICCYSVTKSRLTLSDTMDCSTPGLSVSHHLQKFSQVHVHYIGDAIQTSHPLMSSSPSALNLPQIQRLFQRVSCSHQMTKTLEFQLQYQSFNLSIQVEFPRLTGLISLLFKGLSGVYSSTTV